MQNSFEHADVIQWHSSVTKRRKAMFSKIITYIRHLIDLPFFRRNEESLSPWQVVTWWEGRRIFYNLSVGATGIISIALCFLSALVGETFLGVPIGLPDPPIFAVFAVIAYGIIANVCYTGGWIAEIIVGKVWENQGKHFGKISFALGVVFSILLTLLPGILIVGVLVIQLLAKLINQSAG